MMYYHQQQIKLVFPYILILLQLVKIIYGYEEFGQKLDYVSLPYREIKNITCNSHEASFICDCQNVNENLFLPQLNGNVFQIFVRNCDSLTVGSGLLENVQGLRNVIFENIKDLILNEKSLVFRMNGKLTFNRIQTMRINSHAISGNIEELTFQSSGIEIIHSYGISTKLQTGIIKFDSTYFDIIELRAFKKFSLEQLIIKDSAFVSNLASHSFNELKVTQQILIQNVTFKEVNYNAFQFDEINNIVIRDNNFVRVDSDWITGGVKSGIVIENNNFGETSSIAFQGLTQHKDYVKSTKIDLRFNENLIHQEPNNNNYKRILPLEFDNKLNLMIRNLTYLNQFPCSIKNKLNSNSFYKIFSDTVYFQTKNNPNNFETIRKILETECEEISYLPYIIGGSITLIILLIIIAAIIIWYIMRKRAAQKLNINDPEPRTYEETQIVLKVENAGLLKTDL